MTLLFLLFKTHANKMTSPVKLNQTIQSPYFA